MFRTASDHRQGNNVSCRLAMPLPIPDLDDRSFDQLVDEARALIPKHLPTWTDHNFSDPGITYLELFAFFIENAIYQINRVPERSLTHFAGLLGVAREPDEPVELLFRRVRAKLDTRERSITLEEVRQQILAQPAARWQKEPPWRQIARVETTFERKALPNVFPAELRLKVIIVPEPIGADLTPTPSLELREVVYKFLRERVPIGTRFQVLAPDYNSLEPIETTIVRSRRSRLDRETIRQNVVTAVREFLHPTRGGSDRRGWPLGRPVFRSELYAVIEGLPGVDHVHALDLHKDQMEGATPPSSEDKSSETLWKLRDPTSLIAWADESFAVTVVDQ